MKSVEFWGIVFRSTSHMHWFQASMVALAISFGWYLIILVISRKQSGFISLHTILWIVILAYHTGVLLYVSIVMVTKLAMNEPVNGQTCSIDCIWFNALMIAIYLSLCWITKAIANRKQPIKKATGIVY